MRADRLPLAARGLIPTVKDRYKAATDYVRRAIAAVEGPPFTPNSLEAAIETYAGAVKTEPVRGDMARIEARWLRASSDAERSTVARDAELLADRTEENLPGAPQDWKRTNLYKGEQPHSTPATSYQQEFNQRADDVWDWAKDKAGETSIGLGQIAKWLLIGGGVFLGIKAVAHSKERARVRNRRAASTARRVLDTALEETAERTTRARNAGGGVESGLENVRDWMVSSAPPPETDGRYQREWIRGYERMAKQAMTALTNRGVISSPADIKAWRDSARRRLRWDNTTAGQGAIAFLDALARFPNAPRKQAPTGTPKKLEDEIRKRSLMVVPTKQTRKVPTKTRAQEKRAPAKPKSPSTPPRNSGDLAVAKTIRQQLGAQTLAMLGASDFIASANSLQFAIKGSRRASKIRIVLAPDDTYTVEFWNGRGARMTKVAEFDSIYVDQLHDIIESETGLYTRMSAR